MAARVTTDLDPRRRRTLEAAAERILPADGPPGAREAGVAAYVAGLLGRPRLAAWRGLFEEGLDRLESEAREHLDRAFADAGPEERDRLLRELQERSGPRGRAFVDKLVLLCLEGFLGDPDHGGNRDGTGWRAVGLGPPSVGGAPGRRRTPGIPKAAP